ncbi:MAG: HEAT repeat domain-containing protein [Terriglobia bacterium]
MLRDAQRLAWREEIDRVLVGAPLSARRPSLRWRWDREAAEAELLARLPHATLEDHRRLQHLFRHWGLLTYRLQVLFWGDSWDRAHSALVLARFHCLEALPAITALLPHPSHDARLAGVSALSLLAEPEGVRPLMEFLQGSDGREARLVRAALIRCSRSTPERLPAYLEKDQPALVRREAARALAELARPSELPPLVAAGRDPEPEVRAAVARALGQVNAPSAWPTVNELTSDPVYFVRLQAFGALGRVSAPRARDRLWQGIEDPDWRVRLKAMASLHRLVRDPVALLERLHKQDAQPESVLALVDILEREGIIWQCIDRAASPLGHAHEQSQALLRDLLRAGIFSALFYGLEMHPQLAVRNQLLRLVEEVDGPPARARLAALLGSPALGARFRSQVEAALARWESGR